ncbi:ferredoxin reductase family protein [Microbacterium sp. SSM24]|uniref:ferredoxin reductase family protein n=1 Tax=Microbacterium sp. SSM24 TaxID=2991714 RepID=UPI002227E8C9|nr:ferredoxin reductase family protein [Microbacterium sp. SSM24]MCW3493333.1 ferredoxin reductase family protein [Microbacterium sp. SSM24]
MTMATLAPTAVNTRQLRDPAHTRRPRAGAWHAAAVAVVWATSLFVLALWVSGGGVDAVLAGGSGALSSVGRLTGLIASNLLLLQVLLMARIPVFERGFGRDALTRTHRLTGFWSFWLMLAHIVLLMFGYALAAGINPLVQLWEFVWDYPGMLLATAGTSLLVAVTVTSIRRARRRLRYESWHLIHLYAYLGVGLAVPHQLWAGADFTASPAATVYWWTLWAAAAAAVLAYRIAIPLIRSLRGGLRVVSAEPDGTAGVTVTVRGAHAAGMRARGGQFFVWRFLDGPGWTRGHPFSLSSAPVGDRLTMSARIVGDGTERLTHLRPGTRVLLEGPYGHLTGAARTGRKLLLIGAGAGVAPLVSLLEAEPWRPGEATLITRDTLAGAALRSDAIAHLVHERGLRHYPLPGPRAQGGAPWLPHTHAAWGGAAALRHLAPDLEDYDAFVCGPPEWMRAVVRDLELAGLSKGRLHTESFTI